MCSNGKSFSLANYGYTYILEELRPLIERYFKRYAKNLHVFGIKIVDRSDDIASILVLTNTLTLWSFKYSFSHPEKWHQHELQSSARLIDASEHAMCEHYLRIYGRNEVLAGRACYQFYSNSPNCLEKEKRN